MTREVLSYNGLLMVSSQYGPCQRDLQNRKNHSVEEQQRNTIQDGRLGFKQQIKYQMMTEARFDTVYLFAAERLDPVFTFP